MNIKWIGKACDDNKDCKFWSYIATQKKCIVLKSCDKPAKDDGVESGAKGCVPPTIKFVIVDFIGKGVTAGKVNWEKAECKEMEFTIAAGFKTATIEYTAKCGKLKSIEGESTGIGACTKFETETAQPIPTFYVKEDAGKCLFATSPKILLGK